MRSGRSATAGLLACALLLGSAGGAGAAPVPETGLLSRDEVLALAQEMADSVRGAAPAPTQDEPSSTASPSAADPAGQDAASDPVSAAAAADPDPTGPASALSASELFTTLSDPARMLAQRGQGSDGTVRAGEAASVTAADLGITVDFSGHDVAVDLDVRIDDLPGSGAPAVAARSAGPSQDQARAGLPDGSVVLVDPFEVVARAEDGSEITSFPTRSVQVPGGDDLPTTDTDVEPGVVLHVPVATDRTDGIDAGTVRLYTRETGSEEWQQVASFLDAATGQVYGELDHLSQFVVIGTAVEPDPTPRIVLDPDNDVANTVSPSGRVTELPFNVALATQTAERFAQACRADVLVTRTDTAQTTLSRTVRAGMAAAWDPDLTVTLAFDAAVGHPWGTQSTGGSKVYPGDGPYSLAAADSLMNQIGGYTGRPARLIGSGTLPYADMRALPGAVVHVEALYLDHSYDWPVIENGLSSIADGVFTGLGMYLEQQGFDCTDPTVGGWPARPSADELARWRQLGHQNHQAYGADPVSFSTGNLVEDEPVLSLPGLGGSATEITLTYNSQDGRASRVGAGWSFDLGARAQRFADGGVLVVRGDGASFLYEPDGAGGFIADAGTTSTLRETGDRRLELVDADGTRRVFDTSDIEGIGELVSVTDRAGHVTTLTYGEPDDDDLFVPLTAITDAAGQRIEVGSDDAGRVAGLTLPDGRTWSLGYDGAGDLVTITLPDGRVRSFGYDDAHRMTVATDAAGVTYLRNTYDAAGRVIEQGDAEGNLRTWAFTDTADADGLRTVVHTDTQGRPATYRFDAAYRVVEVTDTAGRTERYGYDEAGRVVRYTDAAGGVTRYAYDAAGDLLRRTDPDGATTSWTYDASGVITSETDGGGPDGADRTTVWAVSDRGLVEAVVRADGTSATSGFDVAGNLVAETDALGATTRYEHDPRGNVVAAVDPTGARTSATYDAANRLTSTTDPTGAVTTYVWDAGDRLVEQPDPLGGVTRIDYDANDHPVTVTGPTGATTTLTWDDLFRVTSTTDPAGGTTRYTYSTEDALVATTDPTGAVTTYLLDAADQVVGVVDPDGGTWSQVLDPLGNVLSSTTPTGATTTFTYDEVGRRTSSTDPTGATVATVFDAVGRTVGEVDPYGARTTYDYDVVDQLVSTTDPAGEVTRHGYDAAGNPTSTTDRRGQVWTAGYDAVGRVVSETDPLGAVTAYGYDPAGRLTSLTDALGAVTSYAYDAAGNLAAETGPLGARTTWEHDAAGRTVAVTDPTGSTASAEYDAAGRLVAQTDALGAVTRYGYDAAGRQTSTTDPLGTQTTYGYDPAGQLVEVVEAASAAAPAETVDPVEPVTTRYAYDGDGRLTQILDGRADATTFTYDAAGRVLTETDATGRTWTSTYDAGGRLSRQVDARGQRSTYTYDVRGDLTEVSYAGAGTTTVTYDAEQQPIAMSDALGATAWGYDATGRLVRQVGTQGDELTYADDPVGQVTALTLPTGDVVASTFDLAGRMVAQHTPWGDLSYSYDDADRPTSTVRTEADGSAGVSSTIAYDAAGRPTSIAHVTPVVQDALADSTRASSATGDGTPGPTTTPPSVAAAGAAEPGATSPAQTTVVLPWRVVVPGAEAVGAPQDATGTGAGTGSAATCTSTAAYLAGRTVPDTGAAPRCQAAVDYLATRTVSAPDPVAVGGQGLRYDYTYDAADDVTSMTRSTGWVTSAGVPTEAARATSTSGPVATTTTSYRYDALARLTGSETSDGTVASYGYDATGNRTSWTSTGSDHEVTWQSTFDDANRLVSAEVSDTGSTASVSYTLDGNGSRTGADVTGDTTLVRALSSEAVYGADGRPSAYTAGGATTAYEYDGLGRAVRTATTEATGTVSATWSFDGLSPVAGVTGTGAEVSLVRDSLGDVVLQADQRLAGTDDGADRWALVDALGSVVAQASAASGAAAITQLVSYADYGAVSTETSGWASTVGYSGELSDLSTGTVVYHQRMYDPVSGSWVSPDAWSGLLAVPGTLNGFAFVQGNPVSWVDVLGFAGGALIDGQWGSRSAAGTGQRSVRSLQQTKAANRAATNMFGITQAGPFKSGYVSQKQAAAANKGTASSSAASTKARQGASQGAGTPAGGSTVTERHRSVWDSLGQTWSDTWQRVHDAGASAWDWVVEHKGLVASIVATVGCVIPVVGTVSCFALQMGASAVRGWETIEATGGSAEGWRLAAGDLVFTAATLGLVKTPFELARYGSLTGLARPAAVRAGTAEWVQAVGGAGVGARLSAGAGQNLAFAMIAGVGVIPGQVRGRIGSP